MVPLMSIDGRGVARGATSAADAAITVVLSTRNPGAGIAATLASILAITEPSFVLEIVDQSDGDELCDAVREALADSRVRHFRTSTKGLGAARNAGIARASTELIAMTDDDCEVREDWLRQLVAALVADERVGVVFGNVVAGAHDRARGFIPAYVRRGDCLVETMRHKHRAEGIGACMGIRRSLWTELRGFDQMLGAGSHFHAGEELDFAFRALQAGRAVYESDRIGVVHHGFRTWEGRARLVFNYSYGIGAVFGKHLRCGRWSVLWVLLALAGRWAFRAPRVDYGDTLPPRLLRLRGILRGMIDGAKVPVDVASGHFAPR
jgi:glycosyltransferase involved in cell wall biosynthesis